LFSLKKTLTIVENIYVSVRSDEFGKAIKVKCLVNLGVSYDLPPPGAPQAHIKAVLSISFQKNALRSYTPL